jgi:puromycin-sensitive aminopeptidase
MTYSDRVQLPRYVRPLKYRLTLAPDMEQFTFRGEETIDIQVSDATNNLVLNCVEIQVQSASVTLPDGTEMPASNISYNEGSETVIFAFHAPIPIGEARLALNFTGELNDRLQGFYRSTYQTKEGETRILAATQFEATDARRAFPCWDEPARKATFDVTLVVPSHLTAVSNTSVVNETIEPSGVKRIRFGETPPMSTYLLAFIVGDLDSIETTSQDGTVVRVFATRGKADQGRFALDTAARLLPYFNDYFGISYPLEKLDHLAIPDFAAGAMENWGAITYRETALLFDPESSSPGTRQRIAEVVAHEMAHMWFGDLVTMEWWNDLWLNESFASWMATKAVDHLFPEWDMWTQFVLHDLNAGLGLDGLENSHPIEQAVRNPAEINQLFDAISYSKGASIIRMLEQFLGPEQFRKGLHRYLSAHAYDNARGLDLWQAMEDETHLPVVSMMGSWINQTGYPVVQAYVRREADKTSVRLSQQRFLYSGPNQDATTWDVPVGVSTQRAQETLFTIMSGRDATLDLGKQGESWVKVNTGQTGFYRVQYQDEEWARLIPAVESLKLPVADRLGLQADAYALARAGMIPATRFLDLAKAYKKELEYAVWADLAGNLSHLEGLVSQESFYPQFQAFGRDLLLPIVNAVGWEPERGEGHLQILLRSVVLGHIGTLEDGDTLQEAQNRFLRFLEEPSSLPPELKGVVYSLAARSGNNATFDSLRRLSEEADLQEEKMRLLLAMARFQDKEILKKTLDLSLSSEVRSQDTVILVSSVAGNTYGRDLAWEYIKDNWAEFDKRYGAGGFAMMRLVSITGGFSTPEARREVEEFFQRNPVPSATRTIQQSLERIDLNVHWLDRNRDDLARWFGG